MAELILTEEEKAAPSYLDWDDAALGKFTKLVARWLEQYHEDANGLHRVTAASCAMLLVGATASANADRLVLNLDEHSTAGRITGDWTITVERTKAPADGSIGMEKET